MKIFWNKMFDTINLSFTSHLVTQIIYYSLRLYYMPYTIWSGHQLKLVACNRDSIACVTLRTFLCTNTARQNTETEERKLFTSSKPFTCMSATTTQWKRFHDFYLLLNCKRYHCDWESISGRSRISQNREEAPTIWPTSPENCMNIQKKSRRGEITPLKIRVGSINCSINVHAHMLKQIYINVEWRVLQSTRRHAPETDWGWLYTLWLLLLALLVALSIWVLRGRLWVRSILWALWRWSTINISKIIPTFLSEHLRVSVK